MDVIKWDDRYRTGHTVVDTQHQELFRMVNQLHAAIVENRGKEVLMPTLQKLASYTVEHFQSEEKLMHEVKYPALDAHKKKHDELTQEVKDLIGKYQSGQAVLTMTLSTFLSKWLRHHIKEDDISLVKFIQAQSGLATSAKA